MASRSTEDPTPEKKKAYLRPSLMKYGKLKDLTTGGSGSANEGSSGKKPRP
jgi:hypothetical protein